MFHVRRTRAGASVAAFFLAATLATPSRADDLLGLYVGAGVGRSTVKIDQTPDGLIANFDQHDTGWKAIVGVRPLPFVGAEAEYVDFGHPHGSSPFFGNANASARGAALFGVAYLPLPLPFLDVYAKAGLTRLQQSGDSTSLDCPASGPGCSLFRFDSTNTRFAWGVGTQFKFSAIAIRAEYEQFTSPIGNPNFLSLTATLNF